LKYKMMELLEAHFDSFTFRWPLIFLGIIVWIAWKVCTNIYAKRSSVSDIQTNQLPPKCTRNFKETRLNLNGKRGPQYVQEISKEMGNSQDVPVFETSLPTWLPYRLYIIVDPYVARKILDDRSSVKPKRPYGPFDSIVGGASFFASNGNRFKHVRKSTTPAFAPRNVRRMSEAVNSIIGEWIEYRLEPKFVQTQEPIDFASEMTSITLDIISRVAFDYHLSLRDKMEIKTNLEKSQTEFFFNAKVNPIRGIPILSSILFSGAREAKGFVQYNREMVRKMLESYRDRSKDEKNPNTIIDMIVNNKEYKSDEERISDMLIYFVAGFDTTAHTLSFALLELAKNQTAQAKLRKSLLETSIDTIRSCPDLKRVVREILRLHPAAPFGLRQLGDSHISYSITDKDGRSKKMLIPKKSLALSANFVFQRDQRIFGSDAEVFEPDRWIDPTEEQLKHFLPFSSGMRNCQGQALANSELHLILFNIISKYKLTVVDEGYPEYNVIWKLTGSKINVQRV